MASGNGDWIFQVGVSTDDASAAVDAFVKKTQLALNSIKTLNLNVSSTLGDQNKILDSANKRLKIEQSINDTRNKGAVSDARSEAQIAQATAKRLAAEQEIARLKAGGRAGGSLSIGDISSVANNNAKALKGQADAFDMLQRIGGNAVFKFVEYELIMKAFNATMHEFMDSVNQAAGIQLEQTLQGLYNSTLDTNAALQKATEIAKRWGADIMDVQQAIGLWTKQTKDLAGATYLANDAEMMHRASGIESQEVYSKSIALVQQLGLKLGDLHGVYDQVAKASLELAVPMKGLPGQNTHVEAMKEIFEGLSESAATLKAMGFDTAGIIAVVSNQVQAMAENGGKAASSLSSMFAALEGKGHGRETFEKILGPFKTAPDDIHRTDELIQKMTDHSKELFQAYANGDLGVRPQQFETLQTFIASLQRIKQLRDEISGNNSKGTLKLIADTEMNTLIGQLDRLKASFQEFNQALGREMLPNATAFVKWLNSTLPLLSQNAGAITNTVKVLGELGAAYLMVLGVQKGWTGITTRVNEEREALLADRTELAANAVIVKQYGDATFTSGEAVDAATAKMEREQQALQMLADRLKVVEWETGAFQEKCAALGVTMADVETIAGTRMPSAFEAMGNAAKATAIAIATMAAPLALITTAMNMIDAWNQGGDGQKAAQYGLDAHLDAMTGRDENGNRHAFHFEPMHSITAVRARGNKDYDALTSIVDQAINGTETIDKNGVHRSGTDWAPGSLMSRIKAEYDVMMRAASQGDKGKNAYAVARQQLSQLAMLQYAKHHMEVADQPPAPPSLDQTVPGTGAITEPTYNKPSANKGNASEQQIMSEAINNDKRQAMSEISQGRDDGRAAAANIALLKMQAQVFGANKDGVEALTKAYRDYDAAIAKEQDGATKEIAALQKHIALTKEAQKNHPHNSKTWQSEEKAIHMAEAAITKAHGALKNYAAERAKLKAQSEADINKMASEARLNIASTTANQHTPFGSIPGPTQMRDFSTYLQSIVKGYKDAKGPINEYNAALSAQQRIMDVGKVIYQEYQAQLAAVKNGQYVDPKFLEQLRTLVIQYGQAWTEAGNAQVTATTKADDLKKSLTDLAEQVSKQNYDDVVSLLGGKDPEQIAQAAAMDELFKGYRQVFDEASSLKKLEESYHGNIPTDIQKTIDATRENLNAQLQLVDAVAKEKAERDAIVNSAWYKGVQSGLDKFGSQQISNMENRFFGGKNQSPLKQMMGDITKSVMDSWWKETSSKMMEALLPNDVKTAEQQYRDAIKKHAEDTLTAANTMRDAAKNQIDAANTMANAAGVSGTGVTATGSGTGVRSSSGAVGIGLAAGAVAAVGGKFGDPTSSNTQQFHQDAAAANADATHADQNTQSASTTAQATQQTNQYLTGGGFAADMQKFLMPLLQMMGATGGSGVSGAIAMGAGMFLNSSVGKKWLNGDDGKTAQRAGYAMQGIEYGEAFGQMRGGGSHSTWGEVGGAIGGYFGGPLGAMAGSFIGSLFGHADDPSKMPDKYDTQHYGTFVSDINGASGSFNGTTIAPEAQYMGSNNLGAQMATYLAKLSPTQLSKLGPDGQAIYNQLKALNPSLSSTGFSIQGEKDGVFTLGSGQKIGVTDYENLVQAFDKLKNAAGGAANALAPIMSINAYGAGAGYFGPNPYNMPGVSASEAKAMRDSGYSSLPSTSYQQTSPYSAPGVPGFRNNLANTPINKNAAQMVQNIVRVTTPIYLDGKVIAQAVNAVNTQTAQAQGQWAA